MSSYFKKRRIVKRYKLIILSLSLFLGATIVWFNREGELFIETPIESEELMSLENKKVLLKKNNLFFIHDIKNNLGIKEEYNNIEKISDELYILEKSKVKTIYNMKNKKELLIDKIYRLTPEYYSIFFNGKYGIVDKKLEIKLDINKDSIYTSHGKFYLVKEEGVTYLLDEKLENKKVFKYSEAEVALKEYFFIKENDKTGIVDVNEDIKIPVEYDKFVLLNDDDCLIGYKDKKQYFINLSLNLVKEINYDNFAQEKEGKIMVLKDGKLGFINLMGEIEIPLEYEGAFSFREEKKIIQLKKGDLWYLMDLATKELKELPYDDIGELIDGLMVVTRDGKYGFINEDGKEVIETNYVYAENFNKGRAIVATNDGYGVIDKKGKILIPFDYDEIYFKGNRFYVWLKGKVGLFNLKGYNLLPLEYDNLGEEEHSYISYKKDGVNGIIKVSGVGNGN